MKKLSRVHGGGSGGKRCVAVSKSHRMGLMTCACARVQGRGEGKCVVVLSSLSLPPDGGGKEGWLRYATGLMERKR